MERRGGRVREGFRGWSRSGAGARAGVTLGKLSGQRETEGKEPGGKTEESGSH